MRLKKNCVFFNAKTNEVGGTPDWEHTLGQGTPLYLLKENGCSPILNGMAYNIKTVDGFHYGKGGSKYDIQIVSVFDNVKLKIYNSKEKTISNHSLNNSLIIVLVRQNQGTHLGRRLLKMSNGFSYGEVNNESFYEEVNDLVSDPWFGYSFEYDNKESGALILTIIRAPRLSPDPTDENIRYRSKAERGSIWEELILEFERKFEPIIGGSTKASPPQIELATSDVPNSIPRNKIIYGAPGTGKSYELREQANKIGFNEDNIIRVTFHPNYSYQQFVGSYKPSPIYKNVLNEEIVFYGSDKTTELESYQMKEPLIDYTFIPGPFLNLLVKSFRNKGQNYLLIIEEINRAPVSSVFGDVFQLLDRDKNGVSEYSISFNEEAKSFLRANGILQTEIKIPNNFFIWATMNSADQGVMPLDAAFKRRWAFEYLPLDKKQQIVADRNITFQGETYDWNAFRTKINDRLKSIGVAEDKLIGPFFMSQNELSDQNAIKNKLLLYLRDDVVRYNPESLFNKKTYSDIIAKYDNHEQVFVGLEFVVDNQQLDGQEG